jgi:diguanylate cyclase (GGDEF)-like protein
VVNLDLNGLKLVNDRDGHEAGDRLLVRVGELLRKVFYDEDVYRTGGDEFIVIIEGISEAVFERKGKFFEIKKLTKGENNDTAKTSTMPNMWGNT